MANPARPPLAIALAIALAIIALPTPAHAFCGFYVSGANGDLYNEATKVVLMRQGRTTVLSMQNAYQGPPEDFALVVPVPVVLHEENVKTLPRAVFDRVDQLAAPRLVEYWEQNPCPRRMRRTATSMRSRGSGDLDDLLNSSLGGGGRHRVRVEAEFTVGEYDIQILSAENSSGLESWLHEQHYNIPAGAGDVLRPYAERGAKFFVAKVDAERVTFSGGRAILSPLRFHYESDEFSLPVRLGLLNSNGTQDLIVHIVAPNQRYEAANYPNARRAESPRPTLGTNRALEDASVPSALRHAELVARLHRMRAPAPRRLGRTAERSASEGGLRNEHRIHSATPRTARALDPGRRSRDRTAALPTRRADRALAQAGGPAIRRHRRRERRDPGLVPRALALETAESVTRTELQSERPDVGSGHHVGR